jgi:hypothetical protein
MATISTSRKLLLALLLAYLVGMGGWLGYGIFTETGLAGWFMQLQMRYLDGSRQSLTMLGCVVAFILGIIPLMLLTKRLDQREGGNPFAPGTAGTTAPELMVASPRTVKLVLAGSTLAISLLAYVVLTRADAKLLAAPMVTVDLTAGQPVPAGTTVARMSGVFNTDYLFVLEKKQVGGTPSHSYYVPLTPADWKPSQPVQVVLRTLSGAYYDSLNRRALVYETATPFPATFDGSVSQDNLPTYVQESFTRQGLRLASPVFVLDDQGANQGTITPVGGSKRWHILVFGLLLALFFLFRKLPVASGTRPISGPAGMHGE